MKAQARALLDHQLTTLLTACKTDDEFCERLLYAQVVINRSLEDFTEEEREDAYERIYEKCTGSADSPLFALLQGNRIAVVRIRKISQSRKTDCEVCNMTVKHMKELLNHLPDNAEILYWDGDNGGWTGFDEIEYTETLDVSGYGREKKYRYGKFVKLED